MINQAQEVFCQGRFPASLIYVPIVSPWPAVPSTLMPLPSRQDKSGRVAPRGQIYLYSCKLPSELV